MDGNHANSTEENMVVKIAALLLVNVEQTILVLDIASMEPRLLKMQYQLRP
jgi:hypothetical protein